MNELKSVYIDRTGDWVRSGNDTGKFYLKEEVDAVIDELQNTNVMLADNAVKLNRELESLKAEHHKERHEYIEMVEQLKAKLEDAKATAYAESVDAGMENVKLKRALWLARSERARLKVLEYWPDYCHNAHCRIAEQKWDKVERKCRAMAEKFK